MLELRGWSAIDPGFAARKRSMATVTGALSSKCSSMRSCGPSSSMPRRLKSTSSCLVSASRLISPWRKSSSSRSSNAPWFCACVSDHSVFLPSRTSSCRYSTANCHATATLNRKNSSTMPSRNSQRRRARTMSMACRVLRTTMAAAQLRAPDRGSAMSFHATAMSSATSSAWRLVSVLLNRLRRW